MKFNQGSFDSATGPITDLLKVERVLKETVSTDDALLGCQWCVYTRSLYDFIGDPR